MTSKSPTQHVAPVHPVLTSIFGRHRSHNTDQLEAALDTVFERFVYRPVRGRIGFDILAQRLEEARGEARRLTLNCYDFSCLFVSHLRASGWREDEVWVAPCDILGRDGKAIEHFHCCVLVRRGELRLIDPCHPKQPSLGKPRILKHYRFHMFFNDQALVATRDEKESLLEPLPFRSRMRSYLYGAGDPEVGRLIAKPAFRKLVSGLFPRPSAAASSRDQATSGSDLAIDEDMTEALAEAQRHDLLEPGIDGLRTGRCLVTVPRKLEQTMRRGLEPRLDRYAEIVADAVAPIRLAFESCQCAPDHSWDHVEHTLIAGILMDLAVGNRLALAAGVRETQGQTVVWCFENLSVSNAFGVQLFADPVDPGFLIQLWHQDVDRPRLSLASSLIPALRRFALGERQAISTQHWQYLRFLKLATGRRDAGRLKIPVLLPEEARKLGAVVLEMAEGLMTEVFVPAFEEISAQRAWQVAVTADAEAHARPAVARAMLDYATDRLVEDSALSPFAAKAGNEAWGRVLWLEPTDAIDPLMPDETPALSASSNDDRRG